MMVPELPPGTTIEQAHRIIVRHASDGGCGACLDTHCPSADWALQVVVAEQAPPDDRRPVTTVARLVARAHLPHGGAPGRYVDLDQYYRSALSTGLAYHYASGRGTIPYGLEQEIRALEHPPPPWDARLAAWFDEHVPAVERRRTYARPSRRQSATPHIPRPGWYRPEEQVRRATFGVVLDTSGSMDVRLLGKALGAIASYATARDVTHARVVFCDAAPYDAGYLAVDEIAGRVRVRGRGGTELQPAIRLLERAADFPPDGPILIITDGWCDALRIRREHAFLVPAGARLPFRPKGPVFHMS